MGEVPADHGADLVPRGSDGGHVHPLAREVVDRAEEHDSHLVTELPDRRDDILGAQQILPVARAQAHDVVGRVQAVPGGLRCDGIAIGGEDDVLHHHLGAPALGSVEGGEEKVDIDRERVHHHDLVRQCSDEARGRIGERYVVVLPRARSGELPLDTPRRPAVELDEQCLARAGGLEPEGVTRHVGHLGVRRTGCVGVVQGRHEGRDQEAVSPAGILAVKSGVVGAHAQILVRDDHNSGKACRWRLFSSHATPADPPVPIFAPMERRTAMR